MTSLGLPKTHWCIVVADDHGPECAPAASPSNVVTIIPARCYVAREDVLRLAINHGVSMLPRVSEGVATLGMVDMYESIDEDYLVSARGNAGPGLAVVGFAHRPTAWVARRLRHQGAMVACGIMVGYAGAFAAHISKHWPGLTLKLTQLVAGACAAGEECKVPMGLQAGVPKHVLRSLRWNPPSFPQRAFCVRGCGWSSLKSAQAVESVSTWISASSVLDVI